MRKRKSSKNREFFDDFSRFNPKKMEELGELKRKLEEFESKQAEYMKSERLVYNFYSYS